MCGLRSQVQTMLGDAASRSYDRDDYSIDRCSLEEAKKPKHASHRQVTDAPLPAQSLPKATRAKAAVLEFPSPRPTHCSGSRRGSSLLRLPSGSRRECDVFHVERWEADT